MSAQGQRLGSTTVPTAATVATLNTTTGSVPWNVVGPNFGLLRCESGFSIASITASLPQAITSCKPGSGGDNPDNGQQIVTVSTSWPFSESYSADAYVFGHGEVEGGGDVRVNLAGGLVIEDGKGEEE